VEKTCLFRLASSINCKPFSNGGCKASTIDRSWWIP